MEYHSHDWHERQCHPVSEQVVLLRFLCKHSPVKKRTENTPHVHQKLFPGHTGPFAGPLRDRVQTLCPACSVVVVLLTHHQSLAHVLPVHPVFAGVFPSHLPPGPIIKETVKHKPNQNMSRNIMGLFSSFNVCRLTLLIAVNTVDSSKNLS